MVGTTGAELGKRRTSILDMSFGEEIERYVSDAWVDDYTRIGYEFPCLCHFCDYEPRRKPEETDEYIRGLEGESQEGQVRLVV